MNKFYKIYLFAVLSLLFSSTSYTQKLYEKVIYSFQIPIDPEKAWWFVVDTAGGFCFQYREDTLSYFITRNGSIGPFDFIGGINDLSMSTGDYKKESKEIYYRSWSSAKVYGPVTGRVIGNETSDGENLSIILLKGDSVFYYINDSLLFYDFFYGDKDHDMNFGYTFEYAVFGDKGDIILKARTKDMSYLFHNFTLVDSANSIDDLVIGYINYGYDAQDGTGSRFVRRNLKTNLIMETSGTEFEDIQECEYNEKNVVQSRSKTYTDFDAELTVCPIGENGCRLIYKGKESEIYDNIYCECADSAGNYAYFALKDYYLYPVVNGVKGQALTKYGVRAYPLQMNPTGDFFVYYKTDDSVYFFRNDEKILSAFSGRAFLRVEELNSVFGDYKYPDEYESENTFVWIDTVSCLLIRGRLFGPYPKMYQFFNGEKGDIVNSKLLENRFFIIQCLGNNYFQLIYDGIEYDPVLIAGKILRNSAYVTSQGIIFYASDGRYIYEYSTYER